MWFSKMVCLLGKPSIPPAQRPQDLEPCLKVKRTKRERRGLFPAVKNVQRKGVSKIGLLLGIQNAFAPNIKVLRLGYQARFQEPFNPKYNIRGPLRALF